MATTVELRDQSRWDLSVFYESIADPKIEADLVSLGANAKAFSETYRGKLAEQLGPAIDAYAELDMLASKIMSYLYLYQSTDVANPAIKAKLAHIQRILGELKGEYVTFFELEIVTLDDVVVQHLLKTDRIVARHRPWIEHVRSFKRHFLAEPVESALVKRAQFGSSAWSEFFEEVETDLEFDHAGQPRTITQILHVLNESKDADERAEALKRLNDGLRGPFAKYSAQTLYVVAGLKAVEDKERAYRHPMEFRNKTNRIPDAVVDTLHNTVVRIGGGLARRYYSLKAKHLGLATLKWSDRNAPMPFSDTTVILFQEAAELVLTAYESFSPTLARIVRSFFEERRVDVPATKEKRSGAFNSSRVLPGGKTVSFTFLNYLGSSKDVMTLAHEFGHGVHGILAGEAQGPLMFRAPIAYAETASVFGETTTLAFLKERLRNRGDQTSLLALIMSTIDRILNTVVRQISLSNFERRVHGMDETYGTWGELKKLSVEELNAIWLRTTQELYGPEGDPFTYDNSDHLWSYIPHFHTPFYVYGYAFGELLTHSLYAQRKKFGENFEPLYLDLLRSGSTKDVAGLLAPFDLDATSPTLWEEGLSHSLGAMIDEAEELSDSVGIH